MGMSEILAQLASWIEEWAPKELAGSVPGRRPDQLHERIKEDLESAKADREDMIAVKLDALVLRRPRCPQQVARVYDRFYAGYQRWVEHKGACAMSP
eukprot:10900188-Karenia_brevis.AAC.1